MTIRWEDLLTIFTNVKINFQRLDVLWDLPSGLPVPLLSTIGFYFHGKLDQKSWNSNVLHPNREFYFYSYIYIFNKNLSPFIPGYNWTKLLGIYDLRMLFNKLYQVFLSKTKVDSTYGTNKPTQENWLPGSQANKWWEEVHLGKPGNLANFWGPQKEGESLNL